MIVRIQSRNGTKRVEVQPSDTLMALLQQITVAFSLSPEQSFSLYRSPGFKDELTTNHLNHTLQQNNIKHGDLLYMNENTGSLATATDEPMNTTSLVVEDNIDQILRKKDGRIKRDKDPQLCHHGTNGKCLNCAPLEPYDEQYLKTKDPPIKHLSFHTYLRKLTSGVDKGKFVSLEDASLKVKASCLDHAPWPAGICTKCQPSAVTLARQPFRHIDNIMFEDSAIVDRFLEAWRESGFQRMGFLYGRYEEFDEVPLGIKAVVAAIYEPPQSCTRYSIELLEDPNSKIVDELAANLGIRKLGWIFTDLEPESNGNVAYKRNIHTHLLTAEECIMAADMQNSHPNPCIESPSGYYGSKFVTVCVTGDEMNRVATTGYQVSNQCVSLVRDDCLVPTLDAPELGYVRESTNEQYVPDVLYKDKSEYGTEVTKIARPLPLEYLIVELTTTTPLRPKPTLPGGRGDPKFPIENREHLQQFQSFDSFTNYLKQEKGSNFLCISSEFHFLYFLYTTDVFTVQDYLPGLCKAVREQDKTAADVWKRQPYWREVENLISAATGEHSPTSEFLPPIPSDPTMMEGISIGAGGVSPGSGGVWSCQHCTLDNQPHLSTCEACGLPRN